ncbi:DUF1516 family protein [Bifidobacterium sp. ESL0745]|uniref:DUF1516 family protein n=1 Tax=Bifidobacterium sp. ESL0745 TaxID=2983226 RepID=UPI0023F74A50|nr:DUF1516 family protein [Bifidobacterium sp. ESL0745]MDF7666187.1 DUF1516 family protein [Bifidobacterium sp. ESL0745]
MVWAWMHLVVGVVLVVAVAVGLLGPAKMTKIWAMIARVCYILIIVSGIVLIVHAWPHITVLLVVKIVLAIALIALAEIGFAKKSKDTASAVAIWVPIALVIVVMVVGLVVSHGFPLIMK